MNRVAEFLFWNFCIWWREVVFSETVGKVSAGNIIVLYSLNLLRIVRFLNF